MHNPTLKPQKSIYRCKIKPILNSVGKLGRQQPMTHGLGHKSNPLVVTSNDRNQSCLQL